MKSILERQIDLQLSEYIKRQQSINESIRFNDLFDRVVNTTDLLSERKTLFPANHFTKYTKADLDKHNQNVRLLKADIEIIFETLAELRLESTNLLQSTTNHSRFLQSTITRLSREIDTVLANNFGGFNTYIETFKDNSNFASSSSVETNSELNTICLQNTNNSLPLQSKDVDVAINITSEHKYETLLISGSQRNMTAKNLIGWERGKELSFTVTHAYREDIHFQLVITPTREMMANNIVFYPEFDILVPGSISIYERDNTTPIVQEDYIFSQNNFQISFSEINLGKIVMDFYSNRENTISANKYIYKYTFNGIIIENKNFSDTGYVESVGLGVTYNDESLKYRQLSMKTVDSIPDGGSIEYYVSQDGSSWRKIVPVNHGVHDRNIVDFTSSSSEVISNVTATDLLTWAKLTPLYTYGNVPLYNILEHFKDDRDPNVKESDGTVKILNYSTVISKSMVIDRGIGDYSIEYSDGKRNETALQVTHIIPGTDVLVPISTYVIEEQIVQSDYSIPTNYTPQFVDFTATNNRKDVIPKVTYKIQNRVHECETYVDNDESNVKIYDTSIAQPGDIVTVEYYVSLSEMEDVDDVQIYIDRSTFKITTATSDPKELSQTNYKFNEYDKKLYLTNLSKINADGSGNGTKTLYVSYDYTVRRKETYRIFKSYITVKRSTEIPIFPFTEEEVLLGNYHKVNGIDVSRNKKVTLNAGLNIIETTQPHKSNPEEPRDVNDLSNVQSRAGIDLANIDRTQMKAFEKPMRQVSYKKLANVVSPLDHKSYAFHEGMILFNHTPEEISQHFQMVDYSSGESILGKRAVYDTDADSTMLRYDRIPETFRITYNRDSEEQDLTTFYYKVVMSRNPSNGFQTPYVSQISINLI